MIRDDVTVGETPARYWDYEQCGWVRCPESAVAPAPAAAVMPVPAEPGDDQIPMSAEGDVRSG
jgi:hypothetical protein